MAWGATCRTLSLGLYFPQCVQWFYNHFNKRAKHCCGASKTQISIQLCFGSFSSDIKATWHAVSCIFIDPNKRTYSGSSSQNVPNTSLNCPKQSKVLLGLGVGLDVVSKAATIPKFKRKRGVKNWKPWVNF